MLLFSSPSSYIHAYTLSTGVSRKCEVFSCSIDPSAGIPNIHIVQVEEYVYETWSFA